MKLKNDNPNGYNVVINNLHTMVCLFFKNIENWVNKGLQSLF